MASRKYKNKPAPKLLASTKRYSEFVRDRDELLESILQYTQLLTSDLQRKFFSDALSFLGNRFLAFEKSDTYFAQLQVVEAELISHVFDHLSELVSRELLSMMIATYTLTHRGEVEAIGRALLKSTELKQGYDPFEARGDIPSYNDLRKRIFFFYRRLAKKLMVTLEQSLIYKRTYKETLDALYKCLPRQKAYPTKKKTLPTAKPKEAHHKEAGGVSSFFVSIPRLGEVLEKYSKKYLPMWRGPEYVVSGKGGEPGESVYAWEVERDLTHMFVHEVQEGISDAAEANGIKDFVWIAVDHATLCKACLWRSGLTTREIEDQLKGEHSDDESQVVVPPVHFNCFCRLAPTTIDDIPEYAPKKLESFFEWVEKVQNT